MNNMPNNYSPMGGGGFCMDMPGGPGTPEIKGTWISKKTGAEVQVRDCIITENGMSVMLSDGCMIDMSEFSTEFYQISDDIYDSNGNIIGKADESHPVAVPPYNPGSCECRPSHYPTQPHHHVQPCKPKPHPECPVDVEKRHMAMVTDVFNKVNPTPKVTCGSTLDIENAPISQLQMLIDIFGVHIEDIAIYLYRNYYTPEKVISYIKKVLIDTYKLKEPVIEEPTNPDTDGTTNTTVNSDFGI